jgi:hypothetical protein
MALKHLLCLGSAFAAFVTEPLIIETICRDQLSAASPYVSSPLVLSRLAWPIQGPAFQTIPLINSVAPSGPAEVICMTGCDNPPCLPPTSCDPDGLWWSLPYSNLVLNTTDLQLYPLQQVYPQAVTFFYDSYVAPSMSPSPSALPTASPSAAPAAATRVSVSCDVCDRSAVVGVSIMFGIFVLATLGCACWGWRASHSIRCPYCETKVARTVLKVHLHDCKAHLHMFNPVIIDKVTIVESGSVIASEEKEDAVARPELTSLAGRKA